MKLKKIGLGSGINKYSRLPAKLDNADAFSGLGANTDPTIDIKLGSWLGTGSGKKAKPKKPKVNIAKKAKKPRPSIVARLLKSTAKAGIKRAAKPKSILKQLRKLGIKRNAKAILGVGSRKRVTPKSATVRAGIRSLRGGSKAFATFVSLRYSPQAIARYNDYGRRLAKSRRLIKRIVVINTATYRIGKHVIFTDTAGNNPYSCTCPDFSQFSSERGADWKSSKAGPFNPCKHMMAVRDRFKDGRWVCSGGVCVLDPLAIAPDGYATQAECEASVCADCSHPQATADSWNWYFRYIPFGETNFTEITRDAIRYRADASPVTEMVYSPFPIPFAIVKDSNTGETMFSIQILEGGFNLPAAYESNVFSCMVNPVYGCTDPLASNYDFRADTDDGSCI
jgi:hypothetical protein